MTLNLGHDLDDLATAGVQVTLQVVDDIGCLHKRDSDEVNIHLDGKVDVQPILQMTVTWVRLSNTQNVLSLAKMHILEEGKTRGCSQASLRLNVLTDFKRMAVMYAGQCSHLAPIDCS